MYWPFFSCCTLLFALFFECQRWSQKYIWIQSNYAQRIQIIFIINSTWIWKKIRWFVSYYLYAVCMQFPCGNLSCCLLWIFFVVPKNHTQKVEFRLIFLKDCRSIWYLRQLNGMLLCYRYLDINFTTTANQIYLVYIKEGLIKKLDNYCLSFLGYFDRLITLPKKPFAIHRSWTAF